LYTFSNEMGEILAFQNLKLHKRS